MWTIIYQAKGRALEITCGWTLNLAYERVFIAVAILVVVVVVQLCLFVNIRDSAWHLADAWRRTR